MAPVDDDCSTTEPTAGAADGAPAEATDAPAGGVRAWLRWVFRPKLCYGGVAFGLLFWWLSLTPSLLPRGWIAQGMVGGLSLASGYGVGSAISWASHRWFLPQPSAKVERTAWWVLGAVGVLVSTVLLAWSISWQDELRELVNVQDEPPVSSVGVVFVTALAAALVLVIARIVRSGTRFLIRQLGRVVPPKVSVVVGCALAVLIVIGLVQGVVWRGLYTASSSMFSVIDEQTPDEATQPTSPTRSGSPDSLIEWGSLGRQGRGFVGRGPTGADLEEFHSSDSGSDRAAECCEEPIRIYAGLESAPTGEARAELAVRDLERAGGFDRDVLGVFTSTGTGWINPNVSDALEYLYRGDTAQVSMQYSYLPSWVSVLADEERSGIATRELFDAVERRLEQMPEGDRPTVFVFGESLGSFGVENGFGTIEQMQARTDGVLTIGPTYDNPLRQQLTDDRVEGSPEWQPVVGSESGVYFAQDPADLPAAPEPTDSPRVVYLQNASDPVTWWNPSLAWSKPGWAGPPPAADRSPSFRWMPIVTFWQVVGDLPVAGAVPGGHGHIFGSNVADGWLALGTPEGWTASDTTRLRDLLDNQHG